MSWLPYVPTIVILAILAGIVFGTILGFAIRPALKVLILLAILAVLQIEAKRN